MSLMASIAILLVLLMRLLLKKAPKVISYALWGIVLFRLLCPVFVESRLSLFGLLDIPSVEKEIVISDGESIPEDETYSQSSEYTSPDADPYVPPAVEEQTPALPTQEQQPAASADEQITAEPDVPAAVEKEPISPYTVVGGIWLGGALAMAAYAVISYIKLKGQLVTASPLRDNIYLADGITSPFVMGLIKPKIYLPSDLSEREQPYIIMHEQQHIKRLDHIVKLAAFAALCIHWFNPSVWVAFIVSGKDMEMSCDEAVIGRMGDSIRADYAASLLSLATGKHIIAGMPLAFGEGDTKGRIRNLISRKKPAFWVILTAIIAVMVLAVCLLTNPVTEKLPFDLDDIVIDSANAVDLRRSTPSDFDLNEEELSLLADRLSDISVKVKDDELGGEIPYYYISVNADEYKFTLEAFDLNGKTTALYYDGDYYRIEDARLKAYLSDTCAGLENPRPVVEGMDYLLSHREVMPDGERTELLCSYSLEQLSQEYDVYLLKISLYQNDPENSDYKIKNIRARLQLSEGVVCRSAYCSDGSAADKSIITFTEKGDTVIKCSGGQTIDAELTLTGKIGSTLNLDVTYDIAGKGLKTFTRVLDESVTFEMKTGTENEIAEDLPEVPEEVPVIPTDRRPMLYVNDILYLEYVYEKTLPEGVNLIGTIKKTVDQSEQPAENFTSNTAFASVGSKIYANKDVSTLYVEVSDYNFDGYMVYVRAQLEPAESITVDSFGADFLEMYYRAMDLNEAYDFAEFTNIPLFEKYMNSLVEKHLFEKKISGYPEMTDYVHEIKLLANEQRDNYYRLTYEISTLYTNSASNRINESSGAYLLIKDNGGSYEVVGYQNVVSDPYFNTKDSGYSFIISDPDYWLTANEQEMLDWFEARKQANIEWLEKYKDKVVGYEETAGHGLPDVSDRPYGSEVTIFRDNTFDCDYSDYEELAYDFYEQHRSVMVPKGWTGFRYYEELTAFENQLTGIPIYDGAYPTMIDENDYTTQTANDPMNLAAFFFAEYPWIDPYMLINSSSEENIKKYDHETYVDKNGRSMQVYFIDGLPKYAVYDDFFSLCIWFNLDSKEQIPIVINMINSINVTVTGN